MVKIQEIRVQNIVSISEAEFEIGGQHLIVTGKNHQGKSTFLKTFFEFLKQSKHKKELLRNGEEQGLYQLTMTDNCTFQLICKKNEKTVLRFIDENGIETTNAKQLEGIIKRYLPNKFSFFDYLQASPAQAKEMLVELFGNEFLEIVKEEDQRFMERKEIKAVYEKERTAFDKVPKHKYEVLEKPDLYIARENVFKIKSKLQHFESEKQQKTKELDQQITNYKKGQADIQSIDDQIKQLQEKRKNIVIANDTLFKELSLFGEKLKKEYSEESKKELANGLSVCNETLLQLEKDCKEFEIRQNYLLQAQELKEIADQVATAESCLQEVRDRKTNFIKQQNLPADFGFSEEGVLTYKGFVCNGLSLLSSSDKIIADLKLKSLENGELKVCVFELGLIDYDNLQKIIKFANENDIQLFCERVDQLKKENGLVFDILE